MNWVDAEAAIVAHIRAQWALDAHADVPLQFANDPQTRAPTYIHVSIEGTYPDKGVYGSVGKRLSVEAGIVFLHAFVPKGDGKPAALALVVAMTAVLELQSIAGAINLAGADPPTPVGHGDRAIPDQQPGGNYYRCSGSVPFIVIGTR